MYLSNHQSIYIINYLWFYLCIYKCIYLFIDLKSNPIINYFLNLVKFKSRTNFGICRFRGGKTCSGSAGSEAEKRKVSCDQKDDILFIFNPDLLFVFNPERISGSPGSAAEKTCAGSAGSEAEKRKVLLGGIYGFAM